MVTITEEILNGKLHLFVQWRNQFLWFCAHLGVGHLHVLALWFHSHSLKQYLNKMEYVSFVTDQTFPLNKKFSIKDFSSKYDQFHKKLWIWSHLLIKTLMGNFIFCAMFAKWTTYFHIYILNTWLYIVFHISGFDSCKVPHVRAMCIVNFLKQNVTCHIITYYIHYICTIIYIIPS